MHADRRTAARDGCSGGAATAAGPGGERGSRTGHAVHRARRQWSAAVGQCRPTTTAAAAAGRFTSGTERRSVVWAAVERWRISQRDSFAAQRARRLAAHALQRQ